jgi:acetyl-CoA synthetase
MPASQADIDFDRALSQEPGHFHAVDTLADDPAVLIYTSGTTGSPRVRSFPTGR